MCVQRTHSMYSMFLQYLQPSDPCVRSPNSCRLSKAATCLLQAAWLLSEGKTLCSQHYDHLKYTTQSKHLIVLVSGPVLLLSDLVKSCRLKSWW